MHTSQYPSFRVHHNGDYSGDYIITNVTPINEGLEYGEPSIECRIDAVAIESKLKPYLSGILAGNAVAIELTGVDSNSGNAKRNFTVAGYDLLDFIGEGRKAKFIEKLERMDGVEYFKKMDEKL